MHEISSGTDLKSDSSLLNKIFRYFSRPFLDTQNNLEWTKKDKVFFRFLFIFFVYFIIPVDPKFYSFLFRANWQESPFYNLLVLASYQPEFFPLQNTEGIPVLGKASFANWLLGGVLAALGT